MDLIVLGNGPAGITAAITAVNAGLKTLIISAAPQINTLLQEPLQSIHPGLESLLKLVHAEKAIPFSSRAVYNGIWINGHFKSLNPTPEGVLWHGHHISKSSFDAYINFIARKKAIPIIIHDPILKIKNAANEITIQLASGATYNSKYLIDASGHSRYMGKKLQLKEEFYSKQLTTWSGVTQGVDNTFFESTGTSFLSEQDGWTWLAPEPPHRCTWTRLAVTKKKKLLCPKEMINYTNNDKEITSANMRWRLFNSVAQQRILLTGDAAGILDPGAGQGILNACWSGIIAATTVIQILNSGKTENLALKAYNEWYRTTFLEKVAKLKSHYKNLGIAEHLL